MKVLLSIAVLAFLTYLSKADICQVNITAGELPEGILKELRSIIREGVIHEFFGCPDDIEVNEDDVRLLLNTRENPDVPVIINMNGPVELEASKPIKLLIHGWLCSVTNSDQFTDMKNAYLKAFDCNVITVDWSKYSMDLYSTSYCFIPQIAEVIGKFLCHLQQALNVDLSGTHVVGHSMGGQMVGLIGQETQKQCNKKIGRVTGLDPAGPLYLDADESKRLTKDDGEFADVYHTNGGILGYFPQCGAVDFFVNCGSHQPGCIENGIETDPETILDLPTAVISCNHLRAIDYFTESIGSDNFVATSCKTCPVICVDDILLPDKVRMGEYLNKQPGRTKYKCPTNSEPPYAKG